MSAKKPQLNQIEIVSFFFCSYPSWSSFIHFSAVPSATSRYAPGFPSEQAKTHDEIPHIVAEGIVSDRGRLPVESFYPTNSLEAMTAPSMSQMSANRDKVSKVFERITSND